MSDPDTVERVAGALGFPVSPSVVDRLLTALEADGWVRLTEEDDRLTPHEAQAILRAELPDDENEDDDGGAE